ncbi:MAG: cytochrome c [Hyphomicrobiales bacterium]|nr:cytochrome c [Hyphomicrobiales bacterium]
MIKRLAAAIAALAIAAAALFWLLTLPRPLAAAALPDYAGDPVNGERMFWAGGCASCHAARGAKGDDKLKLVGGLALNTPFGVFRAPNISPDPQTGIGGWSALDLVNAMQRGLAPDGRHYYPAFPYASYARMRTADIIDLKVFLDTLPAVRNTVAGHDLNFPFNVRRGLGLWKLVYLSDEPVVEPAVTDALVKRGRYLVEGPGHCGECHTPRDVAGGVKPAAWLSGAPNPEGKGIIPNITPHGEGLKVWSAKDIAYYLESGFTPEFDSVGGAMVAVQENMAQLPADDRAAIAAYLKTVPARPNGYVKTEAAK